MKAALRCVGLRAAFMLSMGRSTRFSRVVSGPMDHSSARCSRYPILLWREGWGEPSAAYWGLAAQADGGGIATKRHPWVFLDSTNGLNGYEDGENGPSAWRPMLSEPTPAVAGAEGGQR